MKKLLMLTVAILLAFFAITACSSQAPAETTEPGVIATTETETQATETSAAQDQPSDAPEATTVAETAEKTTLRFAGALDMTTLDVQLTNSTQDTHAGEWVYCRLVWNDDTLTEAIPQVAESWEISDDDLTYVFHLREGVVFHNGRELTADDVVYSWDRILELADVSRGDEQLADVESYEATGPYEFTVELVRPNPIFLEGLAHWALAIVPEENAAELETQPVSCGPYEFVEWIPNDHATYTKFDGYWDKEMLSRLPDEIIFMPVEEEQARLSMLQTGQVDIAEEIPAQNWEIVQNDPNLQLIDQSVSSSYLVYIFQNEEGPTSELEVRQAIAYAIDREAVKQVALFGHGDIDCAYVPKGHWAYTSFDCPSYNPEMAHQLLEEAGYGDEVQLDIVTYDHPVYVPAAEVLQQNLLDIGIDARINIVERGVWLDDAWRGGNFDITIAALTREPDPDGLMSSVFREGGGNNSARYFNPEVEALFDQGKSTSDREERKAIYAQIQQILLDEVPATKVASVFRAAAANQKVEGLYTNPRGVLAGWESLSFNP